MTTVKNYLDACYQALVSNHPRNWPSYPDRERECWQYIMRNVGHGLAAYPEKDVHREIGALYGQWFVALDFTTSRPDIDAKEFLGWALDAMKEEKLRRRSLTAE